MVQSFENENMISENTREVFMNDGMEKEYEINPNLQIESNHNPKNEKTNCMLGK
jgi:RNA-splicing ligase RtcB